MFKKRKKHWKRILSIILVAAICMQDASYIGNYIGAKCIYINPYWIQPRKAKSFFQKSYGKKIISQTGIGSAISLIIDIARSGLQGKVSK